MKQGIYLKKAKISKQKLSKTRTRAHGFGKEVKFDIDNIEKVIEQAKEVSKKYNMSPDELVKPNLNVTKVLKDKLLKHYPNRFGFETLKDDYKNKKDKKNKK